MILIVEDNDRNMKLVRDVLHAKGFATLEAATAEEGLELARAERPQLVLMDVQLPGMSGLEALALLRGDDRTASIPVIALTAQAMSGDRERFVEAGFDDYLAKPVDITRLLEAVAAHARPGTSSRR